MKKTILALALFSVTGLAVAAPVTYDMDPGHTMVLAQWSHLGFSNPTANFGVDKGTIVYDAKAPAKSSVEVTMPLNLMSSFSDKFNEHLKSADFFEADKFPSATFKSTSVKVKGPNKLEVTGNLTIKNTTKPVKLNVTLNKKAEHPMLKKQAIGFDATTTIKRSDFGLGKYVPMVGDDVNVRITTEAYAK